MFYEFLSPLYPFVVVLHVTLCILLVLIILLQPGKGGDVGSAFGGGGGGGGGGMFGPRGPASLLSRATTGVAVLFMVTSITLALSANQSFGDGSLDAFLADEGGEAMGGLDLLPDEASGDDAGDAGAGDGAPE